MRARRLRWAALLAVAVVAVGGGGIALETGPLPGTQRWSPDARFDVRGPQGTPNDVVLVEIDDRTFRLQHRWPFPRSLHARLIRRLTAAGARAIAYDVQFTEPTTPREDNALVLASARAPRLVL